MNIYWATCVLCFFSALFDTGSALNCWSCDSQEKADSCRDYFNISQIEIEEVERLQKYDYGFPKTKPCYGDGTKDEKTVCLKLVFKGASSKDKSDVIRRCQVVPNALKSGDCPEGLTVGNSRTVEYCGTCDTDDCNSAIAIETNIFLAILMMTLLHSAKTL